ncbi:MAG TPA: DinB family protein [Chloroflexia bacterium]|nr:DinB family protein [Chloroflexia bacterium]
MHPRELFLTLHAHVHAAATSGEHGPSLEDGLCDGLTDEQMRARPDGFNSIVWLLWHTTRFEDVVVNTVLRGVPEVLDRDGWQQRLGVDTRLVGTGSSDEEVEEFSTQVDPSAVRAYRAAVGRETRQWAETADFEALAAVPDVLGRLSQAPTALDERAEWVRSLWANRTGLGLLSLPVIGHSYIHIGEARVTRSRLGGRVP